MGKYEKRYYDKLINIGIFLGVVLAFNFVYYALGMERVIKNDCTTVGTVEEVSDGKDRDSFGKMRDVKFVTISYVINGVTFHDSTHEYWGKDNVKIGKKLKLSYKKGSNTKVKVEEKDYDDNGPMPKLDGVLYGAILGVIVNFIRNKIKDNIFL